MTRYSAAILVVTIVAMILLVGTAAAVPPSEKAVEKWKADGTYRDMIAKWQAFKADGGSSPSEHSPFASQRESRTLALGSASVDTVRVVAIMIDFDDNQAQNGKVHASSIGFEEILFSDEDILQNPTGSMTDFYMENSYGSFYIIGEVLGWYRAPQLYSYYVDHPGGLGGGGSQMAEDAVAQAEADGVDFSQYDGDGDGYCDGLIIIHAGGGAETGVDNAMWSHYYAGIHIPADSITLDAYTMNPEEYGLGISPIGVFCHEYGHFLGLPDLYDVSDTARVSMGLGSWSVMAMGSYNGDSKRPAHFDAWCKHELGFLSLTVLDGTNLYDVEIPSVEYSPVAYRLGNDSVNIHEYWVVENRQRHGFDNALRGTGLLIYHIDEAAGDYSGNNFNPLRYRVALEQADGENSLALNGSLGDIGDPFPGSSGVRDFHDRSDPNSRTNALGVTPDRTTQVGVWHISDSDSLMYADLDSRFSRPWIEFSETTPPEFDDTDGGDGDGSFEVGEAIELTLSVHNYMRTAYNGVVNVFTDNPGIEFFQNNVALENGTIGSEDNATVAPIWFHITSEVIPRIDTFWVTVVVDSVDGVAGSDEFSMVLPLEVTIGGTQVLIVDDDHGKNYEDRYADILAGQRVPYEIWSIETQGTPPGSYLSGYPMVFWHTGDSADGVISTAEIASMKQYLDNDGNLLLSTSAGAYDMAALDPQFMADYFGAAASGTTEREIEYYGCAESNLGDGVNYRSDNGYFFTKAILEPIGLGQPEFEVRGNVYTGPVGMSVLDSLGHRAVLLNFAIERLTDGYPAYGKRAELIADIIEFFGVTAGIHTDVVNNRGGVLPSSFTLAQNYPNPFNPTTTISYTIRPMSGSIPHTNLAVYNMLGQRVITLVDEPQLPGDYTITWNGRSESGGAIATGVYFYRLSRGADAQTRKMVLLK